MRLRRSISLSLFGLTAFAVGCESQIEDPGFKLLEKYGCTSCHSVDGTKTVGPTFMGLFGSQVTVLSGGNEQELEADEEYLKRAILEPKADVVKGFPPSMPTRFRSQMNGEDLEKIVAYIKSLGSN